MRFIFLLLAAIISNQAHAAGPIIWYGTNSRDLTSGGLITPLLQVGTFNTSNSNIKTGSIEIQPYSLNNAIISDNAYYDGANWRYRAAGYAGVLTFFNGDIGLRAFPIGAAADPLPSAGTRTQIKASSNNTVGIGGTMDATLGDFTGATLIATSAGNVGIGTSSPNEQLEITKSFRIPATTATNGIIKQGANRFIHSFGVSDSNFFAGKDAGNLTNATAGATGVGSLSLVSLSSGTGNTAVGYSSLNAVSTGSDNTAIGGSALQSSTSSANTAVGSFALFSQTSGAANTAVGAEALSAVTIGTNNTAFGRTAGNTLTTGTSNLFFGDNADTTLTGLSNSAAVGNDSLVTANDTFVLGNNSMSAWQVGSDLVSSGVSVARTLRAGNSFGTDQAAGDLTIQASRGTGTGAGGSLVFKTAPVGLTGSTLNAPTTALTIAPDKRATFTGQVNVNDGTDFVEILGVNIIDVYVASTEAPFAIYIDNVVNGNNAIYAGTSGTATAIYADAQGTGDALLAVVGGAGRQLVFSNNNSEEIGLSIPATGVTAHNLTLPSAQGAANTVLQNNGSGVLSWATVATLPVNLTTGVTGILPIANGGTNKALTLSAGGIPWVDADSFEVLNAGTSGQFLTSGGAATPTWTTLVPLARGGTNKNATAVNGGVVYSDADSMEITSAGTAGQVLTSNGAAAPTWNTPSTVNTYPAIYSGGNVTPVWAWTAPVKISNPLTLPPGNGLSVAFSPSGNFLAHGSDSTPFLRLYKMGGTDFMTLTTPTSASIGTLPGVAWSTDSLTLAVNSTASSFLRTHEIAGVEFAGANTPATTPTGAGGGAMWSPNGNFLAASHTTSPFVSIYERVRATPVKIANPATLPAGDGKNVGWSPSSEFMAVAHATSPFVTIYQRAANTFTKLTNPSTLPAAQGNDAKWSPNGQFLAVAHNTTPFVTIYEQSGTTFTKLTDPVNLPAGAGTGIAWSPDGTHLAVSHTTTPFVTMYSISGTTFTKIANPATLPTGNATGVSFSAAGQFLAVSHTTTPFITVYQTGSARPSVPGRVPSFLYDFYE